VALTDEALRQIGITLKRRAKAQDKQVDDAFVVELGNYARHRVVDQLDEKDMSFVLEKVGDETLKKEGALSGRAVLRTINRICLPKGAWDLCSGAARKILHDAGHVDAVTKLDNVKMKVVADWSLDDR